MHARTICYTLALLWTAGVVNTADNSAVNITFPGQLPQPYNPVQDHFLGISIELSSFNTLWGNTADAIPNAMQNYLHNINTRMTQPLRIRIGGDSMDSATYYPNQTTEIILPDADAYYNDVPVDFGPVFFDVCNAMADHAGEMAFIIGLSMQDPSNDTNVIMLAAAARQQYGDRLDAMLLGNEPDLYAGHGTRQGYTIQDYIPEVAGVLHDLENSPYGNIINVTLIGGPSVCCDWDLSTVLSAGLDQDPYKYYTIQHYPQNVCSGSTPASSNITYYLTHANVPPFLSFDIDGVNMGKAQGVPVLLTEYNSASCGGDPAVAPTFAATLWAVDVAMSAATVNFSSVFLHTREIGITYNLFEPPSATDPTLSGWYTGSPYYAELVVAESLHNRSTVIVDLNLDNSYYDQHATVSGYGLYEADSNGNVTSHIPMKLVLINFANAGQSPRSFNLAANVTDSIEIRYLLAPSVTEQKNISWAGQTVGQNGDLEGQQISSNQDCSSGCSIEIPSPGLALVLFNPSNANSDTFYVGNSTIAGLSGYSSTAGEVPSGASALVAFESSASRFVTLAIAFALGTWFGLL